MSRCLCLTQLFPCLHQRTHVCTLHSCSLACTSGPYVCVLHSCSLACTSGHYLFSHCPQRTSSLALSPELISVARLIMSTRTLCYYLSTVSASECFRIMPRTPTAVSLTHHRFEAILALNFILWRTTIPAHLHSKITQVTIKTRPTSVLVYVHNRITL